MEMSHRMGTVRPGSVFSVRDFSFDDNDMDVDAMMHNIAANSRHNPVDRSDSMSFMLDLDDDVALAIAIQDSVESAYLDDLRRSQAWDQVSSHRLPDSVLGHYSHTSPVASSSRLLPETRTRRTLSRSSRHATPDSPSNSHPQYSAPPSQFTNDYVHDNSTSSDTPSIISHRSNLSLRTVSSSSGSTSDITHASKRSSVDVAAQTLQRAFSGYQGLSRANSTRSTQESSMPRHTPIDTHAELLKYRDIFAPRDTVFSCLTCGHSVSTEDSHQPLTSPPPYQPSIYPYIHLICPNTTCHQVYCRGCLKPQTCPPQRTSSRDSSPHSSQNRPCCSRVTAIGVFKALVRFEEVYPDVVVHARSTRSTFSSESGKHRSSVWKIEGSERCAVQLLQVVRDLVKSSSIHPIIPSLIRLSLVPKLITTLLQQKDLRFWIDHSNILLATLSLLRAFMDCSNNEMQAIVMHPLPDPAGNGSGGGLRLLTIEHLGPDAGESRTRWAGSSKEASHVTASLSDPVSSTKPIYTLIRELDPHRMQWTKLAERMSFPPTIEKIWALGDGVMYVLLQGSML